MFKALEAKDLPCERSEKLFNLLFLSISLVGTCALTSRIKKFGSNLPVRETIRTPWSTRFPLSSDMRSFKRDLKRFVEDRQGRGSSESVCFNTAFDSFTFIFHFYIVLMNKAYSWFCYHYPLLSTGLFILLVYGGH